MEKKLAKVVLSLGVTALLFFVILKTVQPAELYKSLISFPKGTLLVLFGLTLIISTLKAYRFFLGLKRAGVSISFWETFKVFMAGHGLTPLPGGEAGRGLLLKKDSGVRLRYSTGPILVHAFVELFSAAIFLLLGSIFFDLDLIQMPATIMFFVLLAIMYLFTNQKVFDSLLKRISQIKRLNGFAARLSTTQKTIRENVCDNGKSNIPGKLFIYTLLIALVAHTIGGVQVFLISNAFNQNLSFLQSVFVYSAGIAIQGIATVTPGGLGFTEGGMAGILMLLDIKFSNAIAMVLIFRLVTLVFTFFVGFIFLIVFFAKSLLFKKKPDNITNKPKVNTHVSKSLAYEKVKV